MYFTSSISSIKLRKLTSWEDIYLYNKNNEYRASYEARVLGEREYNRDFNKRKKETLEYCRDINMSYENALKFKG